MKSLNVNVTIKTSSIYGCLGSPFLMDYRLIETFHAIMDTGSVTGAARQLGVSQPAVSATLAKLEMELGFSLFQRDHRRLVPTREAKLLHLEATRVVGEVERLGISSGEIFEGRRGTLTIASNPIPAVGWLPGIAASFRRDRPNVRFRFLTRSSDEVRDLAAVSGFDLGLAEAPFPSGEVLLQRYIMKRVVVLPRRHKLAAVKAVTPQMLDGVDMIAVRPGGWNWSNIERTFDQAGVVCRVVTECDFMATALALAALGHGVCLVDPITAAGISSDLTQRPFLPVTHYEIGLLAPAHGSLTILARAFAAELHSYILARIKDAERVE